MAEKRIGGDPFPTNKKAEDDEKGCQCKGGPVYMFDDIACSMCGLLYVEPPKTRRITE